MSQRFHFAPQDTFLVVVVLCITAVGFFTIGFTEYLSFTSIDTVVEFCVFVSDSPAEYVECRDDFTVSNLSYESTR